MLKVAMLFAVLALGCRDRSKVSPIDVARATVKKYALEALPSWRQANPGKRCPAKLEDLDEYMNNRDISDPWGHDYVMACVGDRFVVRSFGPDGLDGTADDISSDQ